MSRRQYHTMIWSRNELVSTHDGSAAVVGLATCAALLNHDRVCVRVVALKRDGSEDYRTPALWFDIIRDGHELEEVRPRHLSEVQREAYDAAVGGAFEALEAVA